MIVFRISVHTEKPEEVLLAEDIFTNAGAEDICTTGEAAAPDAPATRKDCGENEGNAGQVQLHRRFRMTPAARLIFTLAVGL